MGGELLLILFYPKFLINEGVIIMRKTFKPIDLDCANCARKMEEAIGKIDGVDEVTVSFMTQKLTIAAADDKFDSVLKQAVKAIKRVEPDCTVVIS